VADQSHLEDMRAAVRGDLERARARNPGIFEGQVAVEAVEPEPEPEPTPPPVPEPIPQPVPEPTPEPVPEPTPPLIPEPMPEPSPPPAGRSFWSRLFRR
jgi:hypothetical protein